MSSLSTATGAKHTCQLCGYQTLQKTHLKLHSQAAHQGRRFQCSECEYQATKKSSIDSHNTSVHIGHSGRKPCNSSEICTYGSEIPMSRVRPSV